MYTASARGCGDLPNLHLLPAVKEFSVFSILMYIQRMYDLTSSHFGPPLYTPFLKLVFESKYYSDLSVSVGVKMPQEKSLA